MFNGTTAAVYADHRTNAFNDATRAGQLQGPLDSEADEPRCNIMI
jgi:hypothetical protein